MNTAQIPLDLNKISCSGSFLSDFVEKYTNACSVKDMYSKKIILTNSKEAMYLGVKSFEDIIGFTQYDIFVQDVLNRKRKLSLDSVIIENEQNNVRMVDELEGQLLLNKRPLEHNFININFNGLIKLERLVKIPIFGKDQKRVIACLSLFYDLTEKLSLKVIFQLYQKYYPNNKKYINKTMRHLNLDKYFNPLDPPTCREIQILFAMQEDDRHKSIAKKLKCSAATISNHIAHIQSKLLSPFSIYDVVCYLRIKHINRENVFIPA